MSSGTAETRAIRRTLCRASTPFKRFSGVFAGAFHSLDGRAGIPGTIGTLRKKGEATILATGVGDGDGYVMLDYKQRGKRDTFVLTLDIPGIGTRSEEIILRANGWAETSFDVDTGTWMLETK